MHGALRWATNFLTGRMMLAGENEIPMPTVRFIWTCMCFRARKGSQSNEDTGSTSASHSITHVSSWLLSDQVDNVEMVLLQVRAALVRFIPIARERHVGPNSM